MATTVTYKGETLTTVDNATKKLLTAGKYCEDDFTLVDVSGGGGGGATNIVQGTFITGTTRDTVETITLPYTGNGYPIAFAIYIKNGMYNNGTGGDTTWFNGTNRYDVGAFYGSKCRINEAPSYSQYYDDSKFCVAGVMKGSATNPGTYSVFHSEVAATLCETGDTAGDASNCVRFIANNKTLQYYIGNLSNTTRGFMPGTEYSYIVIYSS